MTLARTSVVFAMFGGAWIAVLGAVQAAHPVRALALTAHHLKDLPKVMADRYFGMAVLAFGAVLYRDPAVIAWLFAVLSLLGFADAWRYHRAGKPFVSHFAAGALALVVAAVALLALNSGVTP